MSDTDDEPKLFPCKVCGEDTESVICDQCWEDFKQIAGITNGKVDE